MRLHHVNLGVPVGGIAAQSTFLVDGIGYQRIDVPDELRDVANWFEAPDRTQIHLTEDPDHRAPARAHVAIELGDELSTVEAHFRAVGAVFTADRVREGIRVVNCLDPAGNLWELRGSPTA